MKSEDGQTKPKMGAANSTYTEANVKTLDWKEHIRLRPGMYIGRLGDGTSKDDGIYLLLKEVVDNAVDEFIMGSGREVRITLADDVGNGKIRFVHSVCYGHAADQHHRSEASAHQAGGGFDARTPYVAAQHDHRIGFRRPVVLNQGAAKRAEP